jgi:voltage-gated potassium channel
VERLNRSYAAAFAIFEQFSVGIFCIEYLLRLWSCTDASTSGARLNARLRYAATPMALIDLLAILPAFFSGNQVDLRFVRSVRLLRLARSLKVVRYSTALQTLGSVARAKRDELALSLFLGVILLVCAAGGIYFAEHEVQPEVFASIPSAMWWAVTTLTTVGYGDVYPVTVLGRLFGGLVAVTGVGLFALPTGILASGFAEHMRPPRRTAGVCPHCGRSLAD